MWNRYGNHSACRGGRQKWQSYNIFIEFVLGVALLALVTGMGQNLLDFVLLGILRGGLRVVVSGMRIFLKSFEVFNIVNISGDPSASSGHPNFITHTNSLFLLGSRAII